MTKSFGEIVAEARKKAGISQKELAGRVIRDGKPLSPQYLNDIERDRRNPPSEPIILLMAKELGLSPDYLVLAAGSVPADLEDRMRAATPESVDAAFRAFRKTLKG